MRDSDDRAQAPELDIFISGLDRRAHLVLELLVNRAGETVSKQDILAHAWPGQIVQENSLQQAIARIRRALPAAMGAVEAVYGEGYRFVAAEGYSRDSAYPQTQPRSAWAARLWHRRPLRYALLLAPLLVAGFGIAYVWPLYSAQTEAPPAGIAQFLSDEVLSRADPYAGDAYDPRLRDTVEKLAPQLDQQFRGQPRSLAIVHHRFGTILSGWGQHRQALFHLRRAADIVRTQLPHDTQLKFNIQLAQCDIMRLAGELDAAATTCGDAVDLGAQLGRDRHEAAQVSQAKLFFELGDFDRCHTMLARVRSAHAGDADWADATAAYSFWFTGLCARKLMRFDEADAAFRRNIAIRRNLNGPDHPLTAWAMSDYGDFLVEVGRIAEAERNLVPAEAIFMRTLGADHPDTLSPRYSLGLIALERGQWAEAQAIFARLTDAYTTVLGRDHLWTLYSRTQLAYAEARSGRRADALGHVRALVTSSRDYLYGKPARAYYFHLVWAETFAVLGERAEARRHALLAREMLTSSLGTGHPRMQRILAVLQQTE